MTEFRPRCPPRHETVVLRGLKTHLTRWGPAPSTERPPVFLLHGFLDTGDTFQFLVDAFETDLPFIALDWRGFGRSDWSQDGYWFPDYVADLDALLTLFTPDAPAQLVGHSMGGNVASLYAGTRPERVRSLVNLEGFGLPRMKVEKAPTQMRRWLEELATVPRLSTFDSFEQLAMVIGKRNTRIPADRALFIAKSWGELAADGRVHLIGDPRHKRVNPVLFRRDEVEFFWRAISAPVLMLFGALSEFVPRLGEDGTEESFRRLNAGVRTATIAGAGHMLHLEQPEAMASMIESFLHSTWP